MATTISTKLMEVALATSIAISAITSVSTPALAGETHYRDYIHQVSAQRGYDHGSRRDWCGGNIADVCDSSKLFG